MAVTGKYDLRECKRNVSAKKAVLKAVKYKQRPLVCTLLRIRAKRTTL